MPVLGLSIGCAQACGGPLRGRAHRDRPMYSLCTGLPQACRQAAHRPATGLSTGCTQACGGPLRKPAHRDRPVHSLYTGLPQAYHRPATACAVGALGTVLGLLAPGDSRCQNVCFDSACLCLVRALLELSRDDRKAPYAHSWDPLGLEGSSKNSPEALSRAPERTGSVPGPPGTKCSRF
eukprot:6383190-Pyramimonas_sp.AAC.1